MTKLQSLKNQASRIGAIITCPDCDFEEPFENYLDRNDRVEEESETIHFGCPACSSDSVDLGKQTGGTTNIVVNGIEEMEQLAGE
jgi:Zn finger protein HypA/HybF involved in hydrogenase expression